MHSPLFLHPMFSWGHNHDIILVEMFLPSFGIDYDMSFSFLLSLNPWTVFLFDDIMLVEMFVPPFL